MVPVLEDAEPPTVRVVAWGAQEAADAHHALEDARQLAQHAQELARITA